MKRRTILGLVTVSTFAASCSALSPAAMTRHHASGSAYSGQFSYEIKDRKVAAVGASDTIELENGVQRVFHEQVVLSLKGTDNLEQILKQGNFSLLQHAKFPTVPPSVNVATGQESNTNPSSFTYLPLYLVQANGLENEDLSDLTDLATRHGYKGHLAFDSRSTAALFHRILKVREVLQDKASTVAFNTLTNHTDVTYEGDYSSNTTYQQSPINGGDFWHTGPVWFGSYYGDDFNDPNTGGDQIWSHSTGSGVKVAVVDGGFMGSNESAMSTYIVGRYGTYYHYNFDAFGNSGAFAGYDIDGGTYHGRKCASLVFAPQNDHGSTVGAAPYAIPYLLIASGTYELAQAINAATSWGCQVTSISRGTTLSDIGGGSDPMYSAVQNASASGNVCVTSAGNDGDQINFFPGGYSQYGYTVTVGAHNRYGGLSYWNDTQHTNTKNNTIYAPGGGTSPDPNGHVSYYANGFDVPAASVPSKAVNLYDYFSGTSCATPIVAGVVASLKSEGRVSTALSAQNYLQSHCYQYSAGKALDALNCVK